MRLYEGTAQQFIEDTMQNQVADKILRQFENYYGRRASPSEIMSWRNSLQYVKNVVSYNSLLDNMIVLEQELPYSTERIDCIIFGKGADGKDNVVVIELKQWEHVKDCEIDNNVITFTGGGERMQAHPSLQVGGYHFYLRDFVEVLHEESGINLSSCVYCHNYSRAGNGLLFSAKFKDILDEFPLFAKEDFQKLGKYLMARLSGGRGLEIFNRFVSSRIAPSKKLIDVTSHMIKGQKMFTLIDEQLTANNAIIDRAKKCSKLKQKSVVIVKGGPGTGKSVIALNALAELLSRRLVVYHATGSAAFTQTLRKVVGNRASHLFKYFNSFVHHKDNEINVLICDEAHRIRKTSNSRFTRSEMRSNTPQIEELIRASKVGIFFVDEYQIVRPDEVGSVELIKETARKFGAEIYEFELKTQFRCSGSDGYLNWIDNTLGIRETANITLTRSEKMEFRIFNSPQELYEEIKRKNAEKTNSARLVAGFCWTWSDPNPDGTLKNDVVIGNFSMPWEGKQGKKLAAGIPPAPLWAYDPKGVNQVGSIYTIQGFEFEYVGVIFCKDLVYDLTKKAWVGNPENSADPNVKRAKGEHFVNFMRNVYRTLLTRGMKGCYVYFMDEDTRKFFESRVEK